MTLYVFLNWYFWPSTHYSPFGESKTELKLKTIVIQLPDSKMYKAAFRCLLNEAFLLSWNIFIIACESIPGLVIETCNAVQTCLKFNFGKTNAITYLEMIGREKMESTFSTCMNGFPLRDSATIHLIHGMNEEICWRNNLTFVETVFTKWTYDMFGMSVNVSCQSSESFKWVRFYLPWCK